MANMGKFWGSLNFDNVYSVFISLFMYFNMLFIHLLIYLFVYVLKKRQFHYIHTYVIIYEYICIYDII